MTARPLVPSFGGGETATVGEVLERQVELLRDAHRGGDHRFADWADARDHAVEPVDLPSRPPPT